MERGSKHTRKIDRSGSTALEALLPFLGCLRLQTSHPLKDIHKPAGREQGVGVLGGLKAFEKRSGGIIEVERSARSSCSGGFDVLPQELILEILNYLPKQARIFLSLTCRFLHDSISPIISFRSLSVSDRLDYFYDLANDSTDAYFPSTTLKCVDCGKSTRTSCYKTTRKRRGQKDTEYRKMAFAYLLIRDLNAGDVVSRARTADPVNITEANAKARGEEYFNAEASRTFGPIDATLSVEYPYTLDDKSPSPEENTTVFAACIHCWAFYCSYLKHPPRKWTFRHRRDWYHYTARRSMGVYPISWTWREPGAEKRDSYCGGAVRMSRVDEMMPHGYSVGDEGSFTLQQQRPPKWRVRLFEKVAVKFVGQWQSRPEIYEAVMRGDRVTVRNIYYASSIVMGCFGTGSWSMYE